MGRGGGGGGIKCVLKHVTSALMTFDDILEVFKQKNHRISLELELAHNCIHSYC